MTLLTAASAAAFAAAMLLVLAGFFHLADALTSERPSRSELAIGASEILGGSAIWLVALGITGGLF